MTNEFGRRRILRRCEVEVLTGLPKSTIYLKMQQGVFPRQIRLGRRSVGWYEDEVAAWVADPVGWSSTASSVAA